MNIVDPILFQAKLNPEGVAICTPGGVIESITYGELARIINNIGRMALSLGLARGNVIALLIQDTIFHSALILGLARLGIVTVSSRSHTLPKELGVHAVITDKPDRFENVGRVIVADRLWVMGDGKPMTDERVYQVADSDVCRIILTSGSTGEAKGVAITHRMLSNRIARHHFTMGNRLSQCSRIYCDFGLLPSLGIQFLVYVLWKGGTIFFPSNDPSETIQSFDLYKVQAMVGSPAALAGFTKFYETNSVLQSRFKLAIVAGSQLPKSVSERASSRICPNIHTVYGATETSMVATAPAHVIAGTFGAVGFAAPDVSVEIVDERDNVVPPGVEGTVRIRGPYNATGYVGGASLSEGAFRDGWFYPGDIGRLTADRMLIILGRHSSLLNIGGDKIKPELVEEALASFGAIEQAAVLTQPNEIGIPELWALIVINSPFDEGALQRHCEQTFGRAFVPRRFVVVDALPRNDMGKIERQKLPELAKRKLH